MESNPSKRFFSCLKFNVSIELYFLFLIYQLNVVIFYLSFVFFSNLTVKCTDFGCSSY